MLISGNTSSVCKKWIFAVLLFTRRRHSGGKDSTRGLKTKVYFNYVVCDRKTLNNAQVAHSNHVFLQSASIPSFKCLFCISVFSVTTQEINVQ